MSRVSPWSNTVKRIANPPDIASALCATLLACAGCGLDMADQPHVEPFEAGNFFADGQSSRPLVPGTVARGNLRIDTGFFSGKRDGKPIETFPREAVAERLHLVGDEKQVMAHILQRGRQRFDIFCAACHDRTGNGRGMVVQRGFPAPPSYHSDRLRQSPIGHLFDVATNGFGRMPDYADQIPAADRWAIVAYVRALQLSQHAEVGALSPADREVLMAKGGTP